MAPRKKTDTGQSSEPAELPPDGHDGHDGQDDKPGSEEVMVVPPAADEPVRRDGWVLTDDGWKPDTGAGPAGLPPGSGEPAHPADSTHNSTHDPSHDSTEE